jgi:4-oxalocrotonate tautomerase family enzyme
MHFLLATENVVYYIKCSALQKMYYIKQEAFMPVIHVEIGQIREDQKKKLVENLTKETAEITQIPADHIIVFIDEYSYENIGVGGKTIKDLRS